MGGLLTCLLRWNRSRNEPSLEKTLTGFGLDGALEVVEGRDVEEDAAVCGEAYPKAGSEVDMVDGVKGWWRNNVEEWRVTWMTTLSMRQSPPPPVWTPAPEQSYVYGRFNEAAEEDCDKADLFCSLNAVEPSRLLPSSDIDRIAGEGSSAWELEFHVTDLSFTQRQTFQGTIHNQSKLSSGAGLVTKVETARECKDCCLISNLPLISALYYRPQTRGRGVYYELTIQKMNGVIAIGHSTAVDQACASLNVTPRQGPSADPIRISDSQGGTG